MNKYIVNGLKGGAFVYLLLIAAAFMFGHDLPWKAEPTGAEIGFREMLVCMGMVGGAMLPEIFASRPAPEER